MKIKSIIIISIIFLNVIIAKSQIPSERAWLTDAEKMLLKGSVQLLVENTYFLIPLGDSSGYTFDNTILFDESEYWNFNKEGYIIERGSLVVSEDSLYKVEQYSQSKPYSLKKYYDGNNYGDTLKFFEIYSQIGDTIIENIYFSDSTLYRRTKTIYDIYGREIFRFQTLPKSTPFYYTYSKNGLIEQNTLPEFPHWGKTVYNYNDFNFICKEVSYKDDKIMMSIEYDYTYDGEGNWISCTVYYNNSPIAIKIRNIKYY